MCCHSFLERKGKFQSRRMTQSLWRTETASGNGQHQKYKTLCRLTVLPVATWFWILQPFIDGWLSAFSAAPPLHQPHQQMFVQMFATMEEIIKPKKYPVKSWRGARGVGEVRCCLCCLLEVDTSSWVGSLMEKRRTPRVQLVDHIATLPGGFRPSNLLVSGGRRKKAHFSIHMHGDRWTPPSHM